MSCGMDYLFGQLESSVLAVSLPNLLRTPSLAGRAVSILPKQSGGKGDFQKYLNLLKERMLRLFKTLKVPPGKLGELKNVLSLQLAEKQMLETNEKTLIQLQEEITKAEQSAEHMAETIKRLQFKIQTLKKQLEEDEKRAQKVFQEGGTGALHLPELPKRSLQAPTLQVKILKIKSQKGLLKDMSAVQQSADMENMLTLIESHMRRWTSFERPKYMESHMKQNDACQCTHSMLM
ncbi:centromere protein Q-like [Aythya fuligula]|uniref:Centromere protein Q n=1 Tax=Aythya fuligula TaxID=219594 RepID=A0A6J3CPU7_AYTFU|nr:centromere protein Q-like [Aythya fuligula]